MAVPKKIRKGQNDNYLTSQNYVRYILIMIPYLEMKQLKWPVVRGVCQYVMKYEVHVYIFSTLALGSLVNVKYSILQSICFRCVLFYTPR
jgi:hypothetical protein